MYASFLKCISLSLPLILVSACYQDDKNTRSIGTAVTGKWKFYDRQSCENLIGPGIIYISDNGSHTYLRNDSGEWFRRILAFDLEIKVQDDQTVDLSARWGSDEVKDPHVYVYKDKGQSLEFIGARDLGHFVELPESLIEKNPLKSLQYCGPEIR